MTDEEFIEEAAEPQQARGSVGIEVCDASQVHAGVIGEAAGAQRLGAEQEGCDGEQGDMCDSGSGRLQQLGDGDVENGDKEGHYELKDKEVGDCITGGAIIKQAIERGRRDELVYGPKSNG